MKKIKITALCIFLGGLIGGLLWISPWQKGSLEEIQDAVNQSFKALIHRGNEIAEGEDGALGEGFDKENGEEEEDQSNIQFSEEQIKNHGVTVGQAAAGSLNTTLSTRGKITIHPDCLVHVLPKVPGVVKEARKNIGDSVKQDEIIAVLESREIADVKATYLAALEREKLAGTQLDRETNLHSKKISAEQDFINAKSAYQESKINLQLAGQKLRAFGLGEREIDLLSNQNIPELRMYEVRSPIDGTIINRHITKGEFIGDTTTIYEIADLTNVWVEIGLFSGDICHACQGSFVEVSVPSENPVNGQSQNQREKAKILYVCPIIQEESITARAVAELPNSDKKWRPGTFVNVEISKGETVCEIVVPKEALQNIDGADVVFVKNSDGFEKRIVQTGKSDDNHVEIVSGLEIGEAFADANSFILKAELLKSTVEDDD